MHGQIGLAAALLAVFSDGVCDGGGGGDDDVDDNDVAVPTVFGCGLRVSIFHVNVGEPEVDTARKNI